MMTAFSVHFASNLHIFLLFFYISLWLADAADTCPPNNFGIQGLGIVSPSHGSKLNTGLISITVEIFVESTEFQYGSKLEICAGVEDDRVCGFELGGYIRINSFQTGNRNLVVHLCDKGTRDCFCTTSVDVILDPINLCLIDSHKAVAVQTVDLYLPITSPLQVRGDQTVFLLSIHSLRMAAIRSLAYSIDHFIAYSLRLHRHRHPIKLNVHVLLTNFSTENTVLSTRIPQDNQSTTFAEIKMSNSASTWATWISEIFRNRSSDVIVYGCPTDSRDCAVATALERISSLTSDETDARLEIFADTTTMVYKPTFIDSILHLFEISSPCYAVPYLLDEPHRPLTQKRDDKTNVGAKEFTEGEGVGGAAEGGRGGEDGGGGGGGDTAVRFAPFGDFNPAPTRRWDDRVGLLFDVDLENFIRWSHIPPGSRPFSQPAPSIPSSWSSSSSSSPPAAARGEADVSAWEWDLPHVLPRDVLPPSFATRASTLRHFHALDLKAVAVAAYHNARRGTPSPPLLYGTAWKTNRTEELVVKAVTQGIDTACQPKHYNESGVGAALAQLVARGVVTREQLFIQTKFTPVAGQDIATIPYSPQAPLREQVVESFQATQRNLGTAYVDSLVLHSPLDTFEETLEAWRAMEQLHRSGGALSLGISNIYSPTLLLRLLVEADVKPTFVQNRFYRKTRYDNDIRQICDLWGVKYQSFWTLTANKDIVQSPVVGKIAEKYVLTNEQVFFAFVRRLGVIVITGTRDETHMAHDMASLVLSLTVDEMRSIERLLFNQTQTEAPRHPPEGEETEAPRHPPEGEETESAWGLHEWGPGVGEEPGPTWSHLLSIFKHPHASIVYSWPGQAQGADASVLATPVGMARTKETKDGNDSNHGGAESEDVALYDLNAELRAGLTSANELCPTCSSSPFTYQLG